MDRAYVHVIVDRSTKNVALRRGDVGQVPDAPVSVNQFLCNQC